MAKDKLVVVEERHIFRIQWMLADDDDDLGGYLGQVARDGTGSPPDSREAWEHWAASRAVRETGAQRDSTSFWWDSKAAAAAALRVAKAALTQGRPLPDWAIKATVEKWTPPKGWKA